MKAVIVECSNGAAVALCDDGTFRKLKNKGYSIGQELFIQQKQTPNRMVQKLSICASLALVLLSFAGIGSHSYVEPYSYVSLDINPSIEYALNRYDKVISVSGINTEGQQIVSSIESDIKNQNITTALGVTIGQLEKDHYINQEEYNHVIVSVYSSNDTKAKSITSRVNSLSVEKSNICSIDTIPVSKEVKDDADSLGITPGKLTLIHAVAETSADSDFNVAEWTDKTVSELETTIQQASSQTPGPDSGAQPASANAADSEQLNQIPDNNTANKPDSSTASAVDANQQAGSASADNQTTTDDTTAASGAGGTNSAAKPGHTGNTITSAANGSTDSAQKPSSSDQAGTGSSNSAPADQNAANQNPGTNTSDQNTSSGKGEANGTSPSKDPAASDSTSSPSKGDTPSDSGSKEDPDDTLTEDSSNKKDPYPLPDTDTSASGDTASDDVMQEETASKNDPYTDPAHPDVSSDTAGKDSQTDDAADTNATVSDTGDSDSAGGHDASGFTSTDHESMD